MKHTITKEFRFEAAHRLAAPYRGKCAHLHGHSWVVKVTLGSNELDECGFVQDFSSLKPLRDWIDDHFDHATLVSAKDLELLGFLQSTDQKHFVVERNPTSEILSQLLFEKALELGFRVSSVEILETCTSMARYQLE